MNSNSLTTSFIFPNKNNIESSSVPTSNLSTQDVKDIILSTYDFVGSVYGNDNRGISSEILPTIVDVINASNTVLVNAKIDSMENILIQNNILTVREVSMLQEIQDIFTIGYQLNMTSNQAGAYYSSKFNELKTKYANIVWNVNEGEAFLGMLSIAESSNEYWHSNSAISIQSLTGNKNYKAKSSNLNKKMNIVTVPALDPTEPEGALVHVDAAAYALAWGWAVYNDWSKGNLNESGQYRRITIGLQAAITASTMRLVVKRWGSEVTTDLFPEMMDNEPATPIYNFPENFNGIYYYVSDPEYAHNDNTMYPTSIFKGALNKYYYNSALTCLLPDGYYFNESNSSYYKVINGLVKEIGSKPTNFPGGMKPIQEVIDNLFPICN